MGYNGGMSADADKQATPISVETVEEFSRWVEKLEGRSLLYRGLADAEWQVKSAAHRRLKELEGIPDNHEAFGNYISQLLDTAHMRGFRRHEGRKLSELELLARLQHYGAATCLIDFTHNPLVALWFACREEFEQKGKVVVMDTGPESGVRTVDTAQLKSPIRGLLDGKALWDWEPTPRETRVIAQQSIFVFGQAMIKNSYFKAVHVPSSAKKDILHALHEKFGINQKSLFGDFAGFALANAHDKPYGEFSADDYYKFAESFFHSNEEKKYEKAIHYCDKAIDENSQYINAHHLRGRCNCDLENWQDSIDDLSRAIAIDDEYTRSLLLRGQVYEDGLQQPKQAIDDYKKVIEIASKSRNKVHRDHSFIASFRLGRAQARLHTP